MSRSRAVVGQLLDGNDEVVDAGAVRAVGPFAAVADAVDFVVEADGAARGDVGLEVDEKCGLEYEIHDR